ncbi:MAG TPA: DUF4331 domain-containing protein [Ktedonobacteraceae bacterium]|nr:DUF4331 domain-containing protein [Ktedonobacteraceae bacterium]
MSSHREAPEISKDPVADNTDVYAFVSPDRPDTVTLIANFIPLEAPDGGPNFYEFGEDVLYEIHIDHNGDGVAEITYQFRFQVQVRNPSTFLYNTGPITSLDSPNWNRRQFYSITRVDDQGHSTTLASGLACPPCNIGPLSTPNYAELAQMAVHKLASGETVFAGQRADGFYVDLGAVFDLLDLRPFQNLHVMPRHPAPGVNGLEDVNVHSIAIQVPKTLLTQGGYNPTNPHDPRSVIGVYASASRQKALIFDGRGDMVESGPFVQVSRLGEPLINEVIIPMGRKDYWNSQDPRDDRQFVEYYQHPEVASLLPALYPGVFPHLAAYNKPRADLVAILLTGIPSGIIPGFQNFTGKTQADLLRLNLAIPPAEKPNILGLLGGDLAGFPNGRRVFDDVVTVELRAIAGLTIPLVDPHFKPDAAASVVSDFSPPQIPPGVHYKQQFPYLGLPFSGFDVPSA